jgi:thiamine-phosphate pyrophosphorylase
MAHRADRNAPKRRSARLYLATPPIVDPAGFAKELAGVLDGADVAAVLLRFGAGDDRTAIGCAKALAPIVQDRGAALVLHERADIVAKAGADGAHLTGIDAFRDALPALKPTRIAGCGGVSTRHDAMLAAEAGADYVLFGEPDQAGGRPPFDSVVERVAWWAEVFEVPCVAFAAALAEVDALAGAGADFVLVGDCVWEDERGPVAAIADAARRLAPAEAVG